MKGKITSKVILMAMLLAVMMVSSVMAKSVGTIYTLSGEKYPDVSYSVNKIYKVITFTYEEEKKNISFTNVKTILDSNLDDITDKVLGRKIVIQQKDTQPSNEESVDDVQSDDNKTWVSKESKRYKQLTAKPYKVLFELGFNYSIPFGEYYDDYDDGMYVFKGPESGIGFNSKFAIALTENVDLSFNVIKSGMKLPDEWDPVTLTTWKYSIGGLWHSDVMSLSSGNSYFYGSGAIGVIKHKYDFGGESDSESKLCFNFGGGIVFIVSNSLGIDLGVDMDQVYNSYKNYYGDRDISYGFIINMNVGLILFL